MSFDTATPSLEELVIGEREGIEPYTKMVIFPGDLIPVGQKYAGFPSRYYIRTEGSTHAYAAITSGDGSLENMLERMYGEDTLTHFCRYSDQEDPIKEREKVEKVLQKLNDSDTQTRVRELIKEFQKVKQEIFK